jgi:hypothetical protein
MWPENMMQRSTVSMSRSCRLYPSPFMTACRSRPAYSEVALRNQACPRSARLLFEDFHADFRRKQLPADRQVQDDLANWEMNPARRPENPGRQPLPCDRVCKNFQGVVPTGACFLMLGIDCQNERVEWQPVEFGREFRRYVVDYRIVDWHISDADMGPMPGPH